MRILVTGGAGFIGSHLVDRYLSLGHEVAALDNLSTGKRQNLNPGARFLEVDLMEADAVAEAVAEFRPEVINHHAAQASVAISVKQPLWDAQNNVLGMINLLEAARAAGVRRVLYSSTGGAIYGDAANLPTDENQPLQPLSPYGCSKLCGENYITTWHRLYGLEFVIFRYGNVFGPRQDAHGEAGVVSIFGGLMLNGQQPTIFGAGHKTRDYVFVGDLVEASVLALDAPGNDFFNIATGRQTTDQEVFDAIAAASGYAQPPIYGPERAGDLQHSCLNVSKAKAKLGWEPKVSFREGVQRTVDFLREN
ncbi:MAG TPA: NAD-dependent epimerase/dehydratase family protein [Armatimonadota bacterium]|jgi:UDP-glucose 4-epimerase